MGEEKSDNEIIELYKNGEKEALKYLIERYASPIFNFVAHLTNRNDAPDIVQDIFIKTWKNIKRYDSKKASFKTWIFTIARNSVTDFWRKKKNILFTEIEESFSENIPDENLLPDEVLQKLEDAELLNKTLEKLRPDYREVLVLYYQEEMTFEEIGGILSKPTNTVKSQHRRAIIELRELLHF
ncbi:MAG: RNA polymerase, sigma-24 subunit, ECF subfamily [Parcubacteria group bacterium GW2011_GWF1_40_6]|uniref:RNA polymerase sigma factor n=1 Tax=Candidatus Nomurabacteria bacterium RIFOXYB1_FULL_39_16 TaxID=1801803 RepID=A0A1F6YR24_9BACT|nr:MAG: RNA polymerase, sigma-24 subunit, ECF subfamily [Parcubacteria group bacterium GW2011_GWF1_40_6]OGJ08768.1 MAG: hypothetical protein A2356_02305 [Candidatus Nomurabacteria bacterium RIFOXYB1_FULL_39_16]OGJ14907.1 MAG: hypothetical protein A2585_00150 [Candidatus Nomurabacteria bacterium RIFOXYD1_FULL_39_12]